MKLVNFSIILIVLTVLDFITTTYALAHKIGYEANPFMSTATGSAAVFSAVKVFGVLMIIGIHRWASKKSESISRIGQMMILCMMVLAVGNNTIMIVNAGSFSITGLPASIGNGNGYFSESGEDGLFGVNAHAKNIFVYTTYGSTGNGVFIVEPVSKSQGTSEIYKLIQSDTVIKHALVGADRYLYFVDGVGIKRTKSRDTTSTFLANNTTQPSGTILLLKSTTTVAYLFEYVTNTGERNICYLSSATVISCMDEVNFLEISLTLTNFSAETKSPFYQVGTDIYYAVQNGTYQDLRKITIPDWYSGSAYDASYVNHTSSGCSGTGLAGSIFATDTEMYVHTERIVAGSNTCAVFEKNYFLNGTQKNGNAVVGVMHSASVAAISLGQKDSTIMHVESDTAYATAVYSGAARAYGIPPTGIYSQKSVASVNDAYYNTSALEAYFYVSYTANRSNKEIIYHKINLVDNNSAVLGSYYPFVICEPTGITDQYLAPNYMYRCDASSKSAAWSASALGTIGRYVQFTSANPWLPGNYTFKLYEMPSNALLDDDTFVVLDNSSGLVTTAPVVNVHSPENTISIGMIDNWVALLGMGVTDISKLLFALIVITVVGLVAMKAAGGTVAMVAVFAPYIFFTYIEYIPKWIFIIVILLLAIVSKVFR